MPPSIESRESKDPAPTGLATFVGLRLLSPIIQYSILAHGVGNGIVTALGGTVMPAGSPVTAGVPLSLDRSIIVGMSAIAALKHIIYATSLTKSRTEVPWALEQSAFNDISDIISSLVYITAQVSPAAKGPFPQTTMIIGAALFALGTAIELGAEVQRYNFKQDPKNEGKLHQSGLFGLSRHINYAGFTAWRTGYTLASTGWAFATVTAVWASVSFITGSIPSLEEYLSKHYGQQYKDYVKRVPYKFIPFVY